MYYNVAQLLKEPVGSTRTYGLNERITYDDGESHTLPQGQLSLMRVDKGIWVSADLEVLVGLTCSRCLKRFHRPLNIAIEEEYLPTVDIKTGQSLQVPERAEGSFTIDHRHQLDLTDALRQYTITNQPMKPLCSQECQGLCSVCGADRRENPCSCAVGAADARWVPLRKLLPGNSR